jgi:dynein heavy chain, axonemal
VNAENESAKVEAEKCAEIAREVSEKQAVCERDLAAAEPLVAQAEAALETLNKKDLGETKSLKKPPPGVDDITAVVIILLEGNPKDRSWGAAAKLMNNVDKFMERLRGFKSIIDLGQVGKDLFAI